MSECAVVVAEYLHPSCRRVLRDAGCSFIDCAGHSYLHTKSSTGRPRSLSARDATSLARAHLVARSPADDQRFVLFGPPAEGAPPGLGRVAHPVQLLEWLATVALASPMHPGLKAYLYASDPDDILATLPFHDAAVTDESSGLLTYPPAALVGVAVVCLVGEEP
jgi:hypothetical protein